jgi:hypothetical protein
MQGNFLWWMWFSLSLLALAGCNGLHEAPAGEQFYETPGKYVAAPVEAVRPRVGVPAPAVQMVAGAKQGDHLIQDAGDELLWVATQSGRFDLVERERLAEMISQQGSDGMLNPGTLVRPAPIEGIDFLLLCSIQNFSIAAEPPPPKASVAGVETLLHLQKTNPKITTICLIDLRLVVPSTGIAAAEVRDSFSRVGSPEAMGLQAVSPDAETGAVHLTDEQIHSVMRIVLDDAMRKLLPSTDTALAHFKLAVVAKAPPTQPAIGGVNTPPTTQPLAKIQCPECGFWCSPYDEFCPNCGNRLPHNGFQGQAGQPK